MDGAVTGLTLGLWCGALRCPVMAPRTRTDKQTPRLLKLHDPTLSKQLSLATLVS